MLVYILDVVFLAALTFVLAELGELHVAARIGVCGLNLVLDSGNCHNCGQQ